METSAHHPFRSAEAKAEYLALYDEAANSWPVASECRMVDTSYGQTLVRISGPVNAPPLVLLPGSVHCSLMWKPNIESLSECHRAYAVDTLINTGCVGRSVYTRTIKSPNSAASWLDELFSALELGDSINLVGMSYGGWLTSQYALRFQNRLNRIVLLAPAATVVPVRLGFYIRALLPGLVHLRSVHRCFLYWAFSDLPQEDTEMVETIVNHGLVSVQCFKPANSMWVSPTVLKDKELQSITAPALFLVGEHEVLYSPQKAVQRLNRVAPLIQAEIIPNAGHDLTFVQPGIVNQKVLEFLAQS
jgi:pimeloyl-ACP methyl ester carboxylesterase